MTTREKLIQTTANLVSKHGYFGTGITEILEKTKVPKGSMYHHFPKGKDQLIIASIDYSGSIMQEKYKNALRSKGALDGLCAIINVLIEEMERSDFQHGCPIATVALDVSAHNEEIRKVCQQIYIDWQEGLSQYLSSREVSNAMEKSKLFFTMIEGAFILSKAQRDLSFLEIQKNYLENILKT